MPLTQPIVSGASYLTAQFDTSSTTAVNTNLTFPIGANEIYNVRVYGIVSKATSATGLKLAVAAPTGATLGGNMEVPGVVYGSGRTQAEITTVNTLFTTMSTGIGVRGTFVLDFVVINGATAGDITIQMATVTSDVATMYAKTRMTWNKAKAQ